MEDFKILFAANLKRLRRTAGITQKELGLAMGYTDKSAMRMIQKWELGEQLPRLENIRLLADNLSCTIDTLIP